MKKVMVIGCSGSGKSTFSRALHDKTNIPLYYLDMLFWNADKTTVEKSVFLERLTNENRRPQILKLLAKYNDKKIVVLKSREEAALFLLSGAEI